MLGSADPQRPIALQHAAFVEHLRRAGDLAAREGMMLCLEPLSRKSLPNMLLQHIADGYAVVKSTNHPAVRLIFDTSHVQVMDGDLLYHLEQTWNVIEILQLADNPGRLEPGTCEINFENVLRLLKRREYAGMVELAYGWHTPGRESEQRGLTTLQRLDRAAIDPA